jgi:alpha-L-rhamnosidase
MGETYDARLELGRWSEPGYDDRDWHSIRVSPPEPLPELNPRTGPPVRRISEIEPVTKNVLTFGSKPYHIFDMGQNFAGRVRIKVRAAKGSMIRVLFAEMLNPNGSMYIENLRGARATDYYICKGEGEEVWEPRFTFHGFRYVELSGFTPDETGTVTGIVLHSDMPRTGVFRCSHPLLNQLQHNITWGQKSNFLEVPTDCPQRDERLGWTGDAQVFCRTASFNMDVKPFFHKWMRDARDAQTPEGGIPAVIPHKNFLDGGPATDGGPAWADAVVICPWTIYLCYGDTSILEENYDAMRRYMDFMATHRCQGRIRSHPAVDPWGGFGDWLALDGSSAWEGLTDKDLIGTALYAYDAAIMAQVAALLGRQSDAAAFRALREEIADAFLRRYVTPDGRVMPGSQTAYVLALHFDLLPEELRAPAAAELVRLIEKRDWHLTTGFVGTPYLLEVLESTGHLDIAYKLLEQETFPSWLFPVKNGATTIWERWNGWTPEQGFGDKGMNSFNHYAYGAVGAWMYRSVAGLELDPKEPGYRHIILRPRPGGSLTWAEAKLQTPFGQTAIRWELDGDNLSLQFEVPEGSHATLQPPPQYTAERTEYPPGSYQVTLKTA